MPSKLSLYTAWRTPQAMDFVRRARPPVLKVMDVFGNEAEVKAASPNTSIVGRVYDEQGTPGRGDSVVEARAFFARQVGKYRMHRGVDFWEGWNEPVVHTPQEMSWLAVFEAERVRLLADIGSRACIGNFPTGSPGNLDLWPYFFPALRAAQQHHGLLGVHEYSWPWLDNYFGRNQMNPNDDEGDTGWATGRYRKIYRQYLIPNGLVVPLVITECGLDIVVPGGRDPRYLDAPGSGGWRNYGTWWAQHGGSPDAVETYLRQLKWYDSLLRADDYVLGAAIFHLGVPGWEVFDLSGPMADRLAEYCASQLPVQDGAPLPTPPPSAPPPSPTPALAILTGAP